MKNDHHDNGARTGFCPAVASSSGIQLQGDNASCFINLPRLEGCRTNSLSAGIRGGVLGPCGRDVPGSRRTFRRKSLADKLLLIILKFFQ